MDDGAPPAPGRPFLPTTRLGRIACWLALGFVAWFSLNMIVFWLSMATQAPTGATRIGFIVLSWLGMATGLAALGTAGVALLRHDRGIAVWLCILPGCFALAFLLGELLLPH